MERAKSLWILSIALAMLFSACSMKPEPVKGNDDENEAATEPPLEEVLIFTWDGEEVPIDFISGSDNTPEGRTLSFCVVNVNSSRPSGVYLFIETNKGGSPDGYYSLGDTAETGKFNGSLNISENYDDIAMFTSGYMTATTEDKITRITLEAISEHGDIINLHYKGELQSWYWF